MMTNSTGERRTKPLGFVILISLGAILVGASHSANAYALENPIYWHLHGTIRRNRRLPLVQW
jgi:hypothetical protein